MKSQAPPIAATRSLIALRARLRDQITNLKGSLELALEAVIEADNNLTRAEWHFLQVNLRGVYRKVAAIHRRRRALLRAVKHAAAEPRRCPTPSSLNLHLP